MQFKVYKRMACKVCDGLMQEISPRAAHDVGIHFYCGEKYVTKETTEPPRTPGGVQGDSRRPLHLVR